MYLVTPPMVLSGTAHYTGKVGERKEKGPGVPGPRQKAQPTLHAFERADCGLPEDDAHVLGVSEGSPDPKI